MSNIHPGLLHLFVLTLIIVSTLGQNLPPLGSILPKIDQEIFKLTPVGNGYTLSLQFPEGSSRVEKVELINPGTPEQYLSVTGSGSTHFIDGIDTIDYVADKNGYRVHYSFNKIYYIGAGALKAAAG